MDFTIQEAINIIVGFYPPFGGFYKDEVIEHDEIRRFISAGCASLDEEYGDKYTLNDYGRNVMHPYIEKISQDFIAYIKSSHCECAFSVADDWFYDFFQLSNKEVAKVISKYIRDNLITYGYVVENCHNAPKGNFFRLRKIS